MALPPKIHHSKSSPLTGPAHVKSNCYGTPPEITATIQAFFEKPLFDPCPWSPVEDGLSIDWKHSVFLNPPYSAGQLDKWEAKACFEFGKGHTQEIIWLINYGCTRARKRIAKQSSAIIHLDRRIAFIDPDTKKPVQGNDRDSMIYVWKKHPSHRRLNKCFSSLGTVFVRPSMKKRPSSFLESWSFLGGESLPPAANRYRNFCFPIS